MFQRHHSAPAGRGSAVRITNPTLSATASIFVDQADPLRPAALGVSPAAVAAPFPACSPLIDLGAGSLVFPTQTDPSGSASFSFAIPNVPALRGLTLFAQWLVTDPVGLPAYTQGRKIIVW